MIRALNSIVALLFRIIMKKVVLPKRYVHDDDDDDDDLITIIIVIIGGLLLTICLNPAVVSRFEMMVRTYHYMFVKDVETTKK